jgi:predicted transcriptional regulator
MPADTTVRIRPETRETLRELERETGERTPEILARAVDQFYRSLLIAETNRGYAELRATGEQIDELDVVEGSLADGID